jgi:predicted nucleic acid-binding protein
VTFVDTNVLLDLATDDPAWFRWSLDTLKKEAVKGPLCINAIVYAELSSRYESVEAVNEFLAQTGVQMMEISRPTAFLAAKAFSRYRSEGGTKAGVLPDFFIGAHATILNVPVLTRDVGRYRTYFPELRLIAPQMN